MQKFPANVRTFLEAWNKSEKLKRINSDFEGDADYLQIHTESKKLLQKVLEALGYFNLQQEDVDLIAVALWGEFVYNNFKYTEAQTKSVALKNTKILLREFFAEPSKYIEIFQIAS